MDENKSRRKELVHACCATTSDQFPSLESVSKRVVHLCDLPG
jgi:hypothetical protein